MKILPYATKPWSSRCERRHRPPSEEASGDYLKYRPCLRWEFGFSCAFCLSHEADFAEYGVEGAGLMGVEHFVPQSVDPGLRNEYSNTIYACRFCNTARGSKPVTDSRNRSLLNPCEHTWAESFELVGDELLPRDPSSGDAAYTFEAYHRLNRRVVTRMREIRRIWLEKRWSFIETSFQEIRQARHKAFERKDPDWIRQALKFRQLRKAAREDLERFRAVPADHDSACRCRSTENHTLPEVLEEQLVDSLGPRPPR